MLSQEEIKNLLDEVEADERIRDYEPANIFVNGPLAIIQVGLKAKSMAYRTVLGLPFMKFPIK